MLSIREAFTVRTNMNREDGSKGNCDKTEPKGNLKWTMKQLLNEVEYITRVIRWTILLEKCALKIGWVELLKEK